jgi:hypothetical protein
MVGWAGACRDITKLEGRNSAVAIGGVMMRKPTGLLIKTRFWGMKTQYYSPLSSLLSASISSPTRICIERFQVRLDGTLSSPPIWSLNELLSSKWRNSKEGEESFRSIDAFDVARLKIARNLLNGRPLQATWQRAAEKCLTYGIRRRGLTKYLWQILRSNS